MPDNLTTLGKAQYDKSTGAITRSPAGKIPPGLQAFYDRLLLERALPLLIHDKWGQRRDLPVRTSDMVKFRRYKSLAPNTVELTEGSASDRGQSMSIEDLYAPIRGYGDYVNLTDAVTLMNVEDVLIEAQNLIGENAGESLDEIYRDILCAGTNAICISDDGTREAIDEDDVITTVILDKAIKTLKNNLAKMFTSVIPGIDRFNTTPISPAYWAIVHTNMWNTLKALDGFVPVREYPRPEVAIDGEVGAYENIRFVETTKAKIFNAAGALIGTGSDPSTTVYSSQDEEDKYHVDVYTILILGQNAYGVTKLEGGNGLKTIIEPIGSSGAADPLHQKGTVAWKAYTTAEILNDAWMLRIECACAL